MEFFSNPWVVGVGGGLLSGGLVTLISRRLFSRRERHEYAQKVVSANHELIYAVRPGISEGVIPTREVVAALAAATARKYGVDSQDVFGPAELVQELIKEVMDSSFISAKAKEEYCTRLTQLSRRVPGATAASMDVLLETLPRSSELTAYRARMVWIMSAMMGVVVTAMTAYVTFLQKGLAPISRSSERLLLLTPAIIAVGVALIASLLSVLYRDHTRRPVPSPTPDLPQRPDSETTPTSAP